MASEKLKQGDESPMSTSSARNNKELEPFYLQDGADDLAGFFGDMAQPVPLFPIRDIHGMPLPYAQEMPSSIVKDNASHFPHTGLGYFHDPFSEFPYLVGNVNESGDYHALGDSWAAANIRANNLDNSQQLERNPVTTGTVAGGDLQMSKAGREAKTNDIHRPWLIEKQITHAGIDAVPGYNPNSEQLGMNSQMHRASGEASGNYTPIPWAIGNQFIHAGSALVSGNNPVNKELRLDNTFMTAAAQSHDPEILNGNFLTLGCGASMDTGCKHSVSSKDGNKSSKEIVPILKTSCYQNVTRSYSNSSSSLASGFSSFQKHGGAFSRLAQNQGQSRNDDVFSRPIWNVGGFSNPVQKVAGFLRPMQNAGGFSSQTHQIYRSPNLFGEKIKDRYINIDPYTSFHVFPTKSSIPRKFSDQVGPPYSPSSRATGLQSFSQPAFDQIQNPHTAAVQDFIPEPSVVTTRFARQGLSAGQHVQANIVPAAEVNEGGTLSKNLNVEPANKGNFGQSEASIPVQPSGSLSIRPHSTGPETAGVNMPTKSSSVPSGPSLKRGAPMTPSTAPQHRHKKNKSTRPASHLSALTLPQTGVSHVPVVSIDSLNPSIIRTVHTRAPIIQTVLNSLPVSQTVASVVSIDSLNPSTIQTVRTRPPIIQTVLNSPPVSQTVPDGQPVRQTVRTRPPLGQTVRTRPPLGQTVRTRLPIGQTVRTHPPLTRIIRAHAPITQTVRTRPPLAQTSIYVPSLPRTSPPHQIKRQENEPQLSGHQCHICKRDLTFPPEGPIHQPEKPITTAVLPCGHHFHDSCLQRITPPNQAQDPPCIPCAMGEKS
ncbi:hypothetical protein JCGZ_26964 [Jatropha curcas]|uniref:RING-type domain-containing protein n=1 Tax=Jatropha curcas TaxID=180498 RepID=A0A067L0F9_JATCU|nr:hypothetical protein JCGZ_26964 [Jatropha curcas]